MPFSKIFLWLIYGNHWNIGTENKSKISYEYVVWKDNDNKESIDALVKFCKYVPCKVNLIEYNPIDDGEFQQASEDATNAYITLESNGIVVKVRRVVEKILMPCGQCE
jgi:23S rRNA (adenine2503-C2)-methyltransferase